MKIAVVHNYWSWYRVPLFRKLAFFYKDNIYFLFTKSSLLPVYTRHGKGTRIVESKLMIPLNVKAKFFKDFRLLPSPYPQTICLQLILELVRGKYDVVVWGESVVAIEALLSFITQKLLRRSIVLWLDVWGYPKPLIRRLFSPIVNLIIRHSDACIVHGTKHKEYVSSLGVPEERIFVSGSVSFINAKNEDFIKAEKLKEKLRIRNRKVILYVGRLVERKGIHYLIKAFGKLREERGDVFLLIVGEGSYREHLKGICKQLGVEREVYFSGWVRHEDLAPYYLLCDVFVLPSIFTLKGSGVSAEPWGLVLNEAMSAGKPVIATSAVGAAYDLIKNEVNGFMVKQKDAFAMYKALKIIISDPKLAKNMGLNSKKIIEDEFTYARMANVFKEAIEYAYKRRKNARLPALGVVINASPSSRRRFLTLVNKTRESIIDRLK